MKLGNQQERLELDLQWLGGIFDGEGSIALIASFRKGFKSGIVPSVRFTNTNDSIIREVLRIVNEAELPVHVQQRNPTKGQKAVWHLTASGIKRSHRWLRVLGPWLRGKQREANIMLQFIESRLRATPGSAYSNQEIAWYMDLRQIHGYRTRVSPETICRALQERRYSPNSVRKTEKTAERSVSAA